MKMTYSPITDSEFQYKTLLNAITDYAIYMLDRHGSVISWNTGAERVKGYKEEEILGQNFSRLYTEEGRLNGEPERALRTALREGRFQTQGWRQRKDGSQFWANVIVEPVYEEGRLLGFVKITRDISDIKAAQEHLVTALTAAEAANEAKSAFLAVMSHEIRTPLNGVIGMAQAMAADDLSDQQRSRLQVIQSSGESLLAILNDILDLSKIEAGKIEIEAVNFDLEGLLKGAYAAFTAIANQKGLSFALEAASASGVYRGDPTRIRQIIYNLISNAMKFTESGEVRLVCRRAPSGLQLQVRDTGIGMSQETIEKLFTKFTQADLSTTRRFGGTGLGLAICRELATLMDGALTVVSEPDVGTTFTIDLPLTYVGKSAGLGNSASAEAPDEGAKAFQTSLRVLAAEDNSVNQLVLRTLLNQAGVDPLVVENGAQAVEAWREGDWDVILMDIQMPETDGPTATRRIRELEAESGRPRTPILAISANAMPHQVAEYLSSGMDGHISKPLQVRELYSALNLVLAA